MAISDDERMKRFWDRIDKENPEIREQVAAEIAADKAAGKIPDRMHSPDEIWGYISHNYVELRTAQDVAIGCQGGRYRVVVTDQFHVDHTLKIDPKEVDRHQAIKARIDRIETMSPKISAETGKDKDCEHER